MSTAWLLLAVGGVMLLANALFVAAEFSLVTVDRSTVADAAEDGDETAAGVLAALQSLSTQLSGAQLGITITSLIVGYLAEPSLATLLRGPLADLGVAEAAAGGVAVTTALVVATGLQMVLGELVPKNLAIARPWPVAARVSGPQRAFTRAAGWLIRLLNGNANWLVRTMGIDPQEELASARAPQELRSLVRRSAEMGTLPRPTAALLSRGLEFGERSATDAMTPRLRVHFVDADTSVAQVLTRARQSGLSRFPITGDGGADDIIGVVDLRHVLRVPREQREITGVADIAVEPLFVPESIELDTLLRQLRRSASKIAVVVDEYGGTDGIITLEDLVEELVGDVEDEHDRPVSRVQLSADGSYIVTGLLRPDEIRTLGPPVPDDDGYDTVAGFILDTLDRLPEVGDGIEVGDWAFEVIRMDGLRVDRIKLTPLARDDETGEPGE
ncbi:MAG: hemolysin family protein [Actinobacteria bacterium]|nr:hemolysin family protein [Actinomycetota bacterium]